MAGGEARPDKQTLPPRILEFARSPLAARAERSRFCWDEGRTSRTAAEEDPVQMKEVTSVERHKVSHTPPALAPPWGRETGMETTVDSVGKGNLKATEAMDQEDKGTEKERGGKDPGAPVRAHSESHCCISEQGQEPCGRLGYPKSHADHLVSQTQTLPPAPS